MDRLTEKGTISNGVYTRLKKLSIVEDKYPPCDYVCREHTNCSNCPIQRAFDRLAAYEDTGLTPEQIVEMDKLHLEKCKEVNRLKERFEWQEKSTMKYDQIMAEMTPVGLAVFLQRSLPCVKLDYANKGCSGRDCTECTLRYLQQEVKA